MIYDILHALGADTSKHVSDNNPYGIGRLFHGGQQICCLGERDADGNTLGDTKHLVAYFNGDVDTCHAVGNEEFNDDSLTYVQTLDPQNLVCTQCRKGLQI